MYHLYHLYFVTIQSLDEVHTGVRPCVPLEVEPVIKALATDGAQEPLHIRVTPQVAGQLSLQPKLLVAHITLQNRTFRCADRIFRCAS